MSMRVDRDELIAMARELEQRAADENDDITELLARFNEILGSNVDGNTFQFLFEDRWTPTPEALVDDLLVAGGHVTRPKASRADLDLLLGELETGLVTNHLVMKATSALVEITGVSWSVAHSLCSHCRGLGASAIPSFAQEYKLPTTRDELFVQLRRWIEELDSSRHSVYVAIGETLVHHGHQGLGLGEFAPIAQHLLAATDVQRTIALQKLRNLLGLPPPPARAPKSIAPPSAPPVAAEQRVRHSSFGVGVVMRCEGEGAEAKLTVRFESGTKILLARFLEPLE